MNPTQSQLPEIPVRDVRQGGVVEHARLGRAAMLALRAECLSVVPAAVRGLARPLDALSRSWLERSPSPYVGEIARIAAEAGSPGVYFVNASYEWGCTTRADAGEAPLLRRTLDWPFPGLGRHVEVAIQDGGAGPYANVTWPGAVGVLTAVAPGRFAAAINQAPLYRRTAPAAMKPVDMALNALATWRDSDGWPAAHLLRRAFDACPDFEAAVEMLRTAPLARPTMFSLVGARPGEACLVERTQAGATATRGAFTIANDWHPSGDLRPGRWEPRGRRVGGVPDSEERRLLLEGHGDAAAFSWMLPPVMGPLTRLAVEACPATGALRVRGYEPDAASPSGVAPVNRVLEGFAGPDGFRTVEPLAA